MPWLAGAAVIIAILWCFGPCREGKCDRVDRDDSVGYVAPRTGECRGCDPASTLPTMGISDLSDDEPE